MPEIIWKQGAENDLLQIFAELEDRGEEAGVRFVRKLDFTLENLRAHPEIAPMFVRYRWPVITGQDPDCF